MLPFLLYIGPGLSLTTIIIVLCVLLIVILSIFMILWTSIKELFRKIKKRFK